jgi:dTDP-4-dehydrorhamnose reductase
MRDPGRWHRATIDYIADTLLAGNTVKAVIDRTVSPSYAPDVARATRALIERSGPFGTYHCVNSGWTTWVDLARYVASQLAVPESIQAIETASLNTLAPRPQHCALSNRKLEAIVDLPEWQDAVARHITQRATVAAQ